MVLKTEFRLSRGLAGGSIICGLLLAAVSMAGTTFRSGPGGDPETGPFTQEIVFPPIAVGDVDVNGLHYQTFEMEDSGWVGRAGAPDLPSVQRLIEIPDRSDVQLRFIEGEYEILADVLPLPAQDRLHTEADLPLPWIEDAEIYARDAFFPELNHELGEPALLHNHRVVLAAFFPVQVNPLTGEARVWTRMRFEIGFEGENLLNAREFELARRSTVFERLLKDRIIDPRQPEGQMQDFLLDPGDLPGNYLVFGRNGALDNSALQDLLDWKRRKGHRVVTVDDNEISFTASQIKARITTEYQSEYPVDFVLLLGDVTGTYSIPTHSQYDHYYAKIEGSDILGDVAVGRLSVDNANQLSTVANKVLGYESDPYLDNEDWLQRAGFTVGSTSCHLSMKLLSRSIAAEMVEQRGYNDIDTLWCVGAGHVINWFNQGLSFYNYRGWLGMEGLNQTQVENLSQGPRTPVATIFTCSTGDFDWGDDFSESFLLAGSPTEAGGAVACMGFATSGTHTRYNNVLCGGFYGGFLEYDVPYVGSCLLQGKYELYVTLPPSEQGNASSFANWGNLMGDPGTPMWGGVPEAFDLEPEASLRLGTDHLELTVESDGDPVPGAVVCAYQEREGEDLQVVLLAGEEGQVDLSLGTLEEGQLLLTVTHPRHAPLLHTYTVAPEQGDPALEGWSLENDFLVPGAVEQEFSFTLLNAGTTELNGLSITPVLEAQYGEVTAPPLQPADLAPGSSVLLEGVLITPGADLADGDMVPLRLEVQSNEGLFTLSAALETASPFLSPVSQEFPEGQLEPGITRPVRLQVENVGSLDAQGTLLELSCDNNIYAEVPGGPVVVGNVPVGTAAYAEFDVQVSTNTVIGLPLPMTLIWSTDSGATGRVSFFVYVGEPSQDDPTGPDEYGYWAYEDEDDNYDLAPVYDWFAITPQEGGEGDYVSLSDNGDEQDDGEWLDLPFTFNFYGESYDEVFICSNGFISFAENGFREVDFRNHHLPTSMGPDAMIAPMWDDHKTQNTSRGVYTWHDETQELFVITWYNLMANSSGGPNTFQVVLYDPMSYPTPTGDGPFLFQYSDFNDNQTNWADFPYCSIGFKDHSSTMGMTLKNYHVLNPTMHSISDGSAVFITTSVSASLLPPELTVDTPILEVVLDAEESAVDSVKISNTGEMPLLWSAHVEDTRDQGGPDEFGYTWIDSEEPEGPVFGWLDYSEQATPVVFEHHDSASDWIEPGFDLHIFGRAFSRFKISPNGYLTFSSDGDAADNVELPSPDAPDNIVAGWWDDLKPNAGQEGFCWWWSDGADSLVVSWVEVPHYNPFLNGGPFSFQIVMRSLGEIVIQVENTGNEFFGYGESGTCGIQGLEEDEGFSIFHDTDISGELPYAVRITPPAWLTLLGPEGGVMAPGDSTWIRLGFTSVPGYQLPEGVYEGSLVLDSNDPMNPLQSVPLSMEVDWLAVDRGLLPGDTAIEGAYPNPFNPSTRIRFHLAQAGEVRMSVYNLLGQETARLLEGEFMVPGAYDLRWDAGEHASGIYFVVLETGDTVDRGKLMLLR